MSNRFGICRKYLGGWRIYIGRNPKRLPPRSLVLLPYMPDTIFCGLAGILAVNGPTKADTGNVQKLVACFLAITGHSLAKGLSGEYLGQDTLVAMDKALYELKQNIDLQYALHKGGGLQKLRELSGDLDAFVQNEDSLLDQQAGQLSVSTLEAISSRLIFIKDILWGLKEDLLKNQDKIIDLSVGACTASPWIFKKYQRINFLLNALDRLEVRGRDSSGIQITFELNDITVEEITDSLKTRGLEDTLNKRLCEGDLMNGSICLSGQSVTFTYKTASVTGELGKNCRELREAIRTDEIFKAFVKHPDANDMYLAHTRWASVGAINISNCHPVNNCTFSESTRAICEEKQYPFYGKGKWFINAALNGDIDNYQAIKASTEAGGWLLDQRVTTDTKVIPLQIEKYLFEGHNLLDAFRKAVNDFEGSHAIAMESNLEPGKVFLALHGSGQALFIGLADNHYLFASEVYGLVEETPFFLKMDGENPRVQGDSQTVGQIYVLNNNKGPSLAGIDAFSYDGHPVRLTEKDIKKAEITTRDIDRGEFPHYLLKEILDAPSSIRKTLRGKYRIDGTDVTFNLGEEVFPAAIIKALKGDKLRNIFVIGQGTAAVAGTAVAEALSIYLKGTRFNIQAKKASDLSGFVSDEDLADALVIAVTQSGTTTDTNRAVTMAREKGAHIIAIVNRRQSDITTKAHGVFYTSDGRDIEMSVASTKAFYAQIVAGYVLALFMAKTLGTIPDQTIAKELASLEKAPMLMNRVISRIDEIKKTAWEPVRQKKYWAVVGSGTNKVAADEVRIKLSELCYKTISSDIIEDKKHIDLSAEPLILVMAAGSPEIVLEDIVKDSAIFKAHAAKVIAIVDEGETRFNSVADYVFAVPRSNFPISVIMNTLAGHIWGYFAACSLDEQAGLFKDFRNRLAELVTLHETKGFSIFESIEDKKLHKMVDEFSSGYNTWRIGGSLTTMNVETATDLTLLLKYAVGKLAIEDYRDDFKAKRLSSSPLDMLDFTLGKAIDELARPVDAIRHQAKTVTVGTSRKIEALRGLLFDQLSEHGFSQENLSTKDVLFMKRLQVALTGIRGFTLYCVEGLDEDGRPSEESTIQIVKKGGSATGMPSRSDYKGPLMGTKRTIVRTGDIYAGGGKSDNASIVIIPLLGSPRTIENLLLFHVDFNEHLSMAQKREILGEKYGDVKNLINEENLSWNDEYLADLSIKKLLGEPVEVIVDTIKNTIARGENE